MSETDKQILDEIGKLETTLVEQRTKLDSTEEKIGHIAGDLKDSEGRITEALAGKFLTMQIGENIQKQLDDIATRIERLGEAHEESGVDKKDHLAASRDYIMSIIAGKKGLDLKPETREFFVSDKYKEYTRFGIDENTEKRTLNEGAGSAGGIFVIPEIEEEILKNQVNIDPVRSIARVRTIGSNQLTKFRRVSGQSFTWENETGDGTASQPVWAKIAIDVNPGVVRTPVSGDLMDDWPTVRDEITEGASEDIAFETGVAYVEGDGASKPRGFTTGVDGDADEFAQSTNSVTTDVISGDDFSNLFTALPTRYWANSTWAFNSDSLADVMQLKATTGNYLWQPGLQLGFPANILGRPFVIMESLSSAAGDVFPVWFGDFRQAYVILDRQGIRVQEDPFSSWPSIIFKWRIRTGGQLIKPEAMRALKTT